MMGMMGVSFVPQIKIIQNPNEGEERRGEGGRSGRQIIRGRKPTPEIKGKGVEILGGFDRVEYIKKNKKILHTSRFIALSIPSPSLPSFLLPFSVLPYSPHFPCFPTWDLPAHPASGVKYKDRERITLHPLFNARTLPPLPPGASRTPTTMSFRGDLTHQNLRIFAHKGSFISTGYLKRPLEKFDKLNHSESNSFYDTYY